MMRSRHAGCLVAAACVHLAGAARAQDPVAACADRAERGQVLRDEGKLLEARRNFVACSSEACPMPVSKACLKWLIDLDARIPTIVPSVRDARGRDVTDVRVRIDGVIVAESATGVAVRLDPGRHVIRFERGTATVAEEHIVVRDGERGRIVQVEVREARSDLEVAPTDVTKPTPRTAAQPSTSWVPMPGLVLAGTGVVALGVFGTLAATGASDYAHLRDTCSPRCPRGEVEAVRIKFVGADVALGIGIATLTGAALVFISAWPRGPAKKASTPAR